MANSFNMANITLEEHCHHTRVLFAKKIHKKKKYKEKPRK